jgi:hypothetical protein
MPDALLLQRACSEGAGSSIVEPDGHRAFSVGPFWANGFSVLKIGRKTQSDQFRAEG